MERLAGLAQKHGGAKGLEEAELGVASAQPLSVLLSQLFGEVRLESPTGKGVDAAGEPTTGGVDIIGREDFVALLEALRTLEKTVTESAETNKQAAEATREAIEKGGGTVVHMQHARIVSPDAAAQWRNTVNGESDRDRREQG